MKLKEIWRKAYDFLHRRKQSYMLAFGGPAGHEVLADLARFCRANETCFNADPRLHAVLEGRREVFLRIQQHLNLTQAQLYALYNHNPQTMILEEDDDD